MKFRKIINFLLECGFYSVEAFITIDLSSVKKVCQCFLCCNYLYFRSVCCIFLLLQIFQVDKSDL